MKFIIGKNGLTVKAPGINKEDGLDELTLNLRDLKEEVSNWEVSYEVQDYLGRLLTDEQLEKVDPNILAALSVLDNSDVPLEISREAKLRYVESIISDGNVSKDISLKENIEYDKTGIQYWKWGSIFSKATHLKQFSEMRKYADIAEKMGIAEVKQDKQGWIVQRISNMINKVKLLAAPNKEKPLEKTEAYKKADEAGKDFLSAMEEHRELKEDRIGTSDSIMMKDGEKVHVYYDLKNDGKEHKVKTLRNSLYNKEAADESNKPHAEPVVISDGNVLQKPKGMEKD